MAVIQEYISKTKAQITNVAAKAVVQAILVKRGDGDALTRCKGNEIGVRLKLGRPLPSYTFPNEVENIYHTHNVAREENIHAVNIFTRQTSSLTDEAGRI